MTPPQRGTIIKTPDSTPGLLFVNSQQKTFTLEGIWRSHVAPALNMAVDIEFDSAGSIIGLTAVDAQQAAREKLKQAAQEHGTEVVKMASQGVGALAARMGKVTLIATAILWVSWFFMPGLTFSMSFLGAGQSRSFTLWEALAFDPANNMNPGSHGFLSLVVIAGIVAPIAACFIRRPYARYLYAAPLACLLVAWFAIQHGFSQLLAAAGIAADLAGYKMSPAYGTYMIALASLAVAARLLKRPSNESVVSVPKPAAGIPSANSFCTNCGAKLGAGANYCTECAAPRASAAGA
jgi:hypothetical protein